VENTIQYRGRSITVSAVKSGSAYEARIVIDGAIHVLHPLTKYPPSEFRTPAEPMDFGIEAAKWMVDQR